jgi:hypothetical protein
VDGRAGTWVVDEDDTVSDEYIILYRDAFADEGVRRDLAPLTDHSAFLDFDERADLGIRTNTASIEVHEIGVEDDDAFTKGDARRDGH